MRCGGQPPEISDVTSRSVVVLKNLERHMYVTIIRRPVDVSSKADMPDHLQLVLMMTATSS